MRLRFLNSVSPAALFLRAPEGGDGGAGAGAGAGGASGAGAGDAAGAGAAGAGANGANGAGDGGANGAGAAGAGAGGDWTTALSPELRTLATTKGWKGPADALASYANLEKVVGLDKVPLPAKNEKGERDWSKFDWTGIGRPETPEAYQFNDGEAKVDAGMDKWFRAKAHGYGLNPWQAQGLRAEWNEFAAELGQAQHAAAVAEAEAAEGALKTELGQAFDAKMDLANRLIAQEGGPELVAELKKSGLGRNANLIKFVMKLAGQYAEDGLLDGERPAGGALTPAEATAAIAALEGDEGTRKILMDKSHPEYAALVAKRSRLYALAYGTAPDGAAGVTVAGA